MSNENATVTADAETTQARPRRVITPPVDIFESDEEYRIVADLPGVKSEDLKLDLDRSELTLLAEPSSSDRNSGVFRRVFRVPDEVEGSAVEASLADGVLEVRLPKSEKGRPRRIAIQAVA